MPCRRNHQIIMLLAFELQNALRSTRLKCKHVFGSGGLEALREFVQDALSFPGGLEYCSPWALQAWVSHSFPFAIFFPRCFSCCM